MWSSSIVSETRGKIRPLYLEIRKERSSCLVASVLPIKCKARPSAVSVKLWGEWRRSEIGEEATADGGSVEKLPGGTGTHGECRAMSTVQDSVFCVFLLGPEVPWPLLQCESLWGRQSLWG